MSVGSYDNGMMSVWAGRGQGCRGLGGLALRLELTGVR